MQNKLMPARWRNCAGFHVTEVMVASIIIPFAVGGAMAGLTSAAKMLRSGDHVTATEATGYARQLLEEARNRVATDDAWWATQAALGWQAAPFTGGGTQTISLEGAVRFYCVNPRDCDGDGASGDCYSMQVKVCWDGTACPAAGAACP